MSVSSCLCLATHSSLLNHRLRLLTGEASASPHLIGQNIPSAPCRFCRLVQPTQALGKLSVLFAVIADDI